MKKRLLIAMVIVIVASCGRKKAPYYLFNIGRDAVVTDSTGKVLKDTFYQRVNLGYSYERILGKDTVLVPRYIITIDPARHIKLNMFNGVAALRPKDLTMFFNFTPQKLVYVKSGYQLTSEELVNIEKVDSGYVVFTSMNIYYIDNKGKQKANLEVYTSKKYYGFLIVDAYKVNSANFLVIGGEDFGIYNYRKNVLSVVPRTRPSSRAFYLDGIIMRIEALKRTPYKVNYALFKYNFAGKIIDKVKMPMLRNQYLIEPRVVDDELYIITEKKIYKINPENFSVVSSIKLDGRYEKVWDIGDEFVLYSPKSKKFARVSKDLASFKLITKDAECNNSYVSKWLITCERNDTTFVYTTDFSSLISLKNVLFVKDNFIGKRFKDTLLILQGKDTFLKLPSPYYTYQKSLLEEEKKKEKE